MSYLLTHSLLSAWLYSMQDNPFADATQEDTSKEDFMRVLRREPTPTTEAMQNGIDFEDLITAIVKGIPMAKSHDYNYSTKQTEEKMVPTQEHKWFPAAMQALKYVNGGLLQVPESKTVEIGGMEIFLYGRLDALKAGKIYDIKFSGSYDRGKYIDSTQHPMYLELLPSAESFTYLVSNGTELWTEKYRRDETRSIFPIIRDFVTYLDGTGLMPIYREHWVART